MDVLSIVQFGTRVRRALYADAVDLWQLQPLANPLRQIHIGGLVERLVQVLIIQWCDSPGEMSSQRVGLITGKIRPLAVSGNAYFCQKTVTVQAPRRMRFWGVAQATGRVHRRSPPVRA
jgi:hypothetical protein